MINNNCTTNAGDGWWYQKQTWTDSNGWVTPWPKPCVPSPWIYPQPIIVRPNVIIHPPKVSKPKAKVIRKGGKKGRKKGVKKETFVALILDKSGSMTSCYSAALDAINEQIETIKKNAKKGGDTYVTLILFDHNIEILYENVPAEDIDKLTEDDYILGGCTALRDAMSVAIDTLFGCENDDNNQGFLTILVSDGQENSSGTTKEELKSKIDECDSERWTFTYMLGGHTWENIQDFVGAVGTSYGNVVSYTANSAGTRGASPGLANATINYMSSREAGQTSTNTFYHDDVEGTAEVNISETNDEDSK